MTNYPTPGRGTGYCFRAISFFLSLFLCQQHYEKTAGPICMKFLLTVWSDHEMTWFNFGSIQINGSAGQRSICLLSPAIAQRTGVNKSVSFARWQQGAGFVVPRTTACWLLQWICYWFIQVSCKFHLLIEHFNTRIQCDGILLVCSACDWLVQTPPTLGYSCC